MFQIKNFTSIVASVINYMRGTQTAVTDFNIGSVARTLIESPSVEISELYQQVFNGIREAIPVATYTSFSFDTIAAIAASGIVRVTVTSSAVDVVIPAGSVFSQENGTISYTNATAATIPAGGTTADILVSASAAGISGNIDDGLPFSVSPAVANFVSATNPSAFTNGANEETAEQKKRRFNDYISTLQRSTVAAVEYGSKQAILYNSAGVITERVIDAKVVEPYLEDDSNPVALVHVYIHNGVGSTSLALVNETKRVLMGYTAPDGTKVPGWKAAGVKVDVFQATEVDLNVTGVVTVANGYVDADIVSQVESIINRYIVGLLIGQKYLEAQVVSECMAVNGVTNIVFSVPSGDQTATNQQKFWPGTIAVTAA